MSVVQIGLLTMVFLAGISQWRPPVFGGRERGDRHRQLREPRPLYAP